MKNLTYAVIGTGAIGGFYGGILADSGKEVNFLLHSDYNHVKENGLFIHSDVFGKIECKGNYYNSVQEMPACDVVLVGLKTTQNHLLKELIPPVLKKDSAIILIQNGLGMEEDLQNELPDVSIIGGVAQILSSKSSPGVITHQQLGNLALGIYGKKTIPFIDQVVEDFNATGRITCTHQKLQEIRWKKLIWNIPFNGLSVVMDTKTDLLVQNKYAEELAREIMEEVVKGANESGCDIPFQAISDQIEITKKMPPYFPSMKLDFDNSRLMEIKYMYEKPVEIAKKAGFYMSKVDMLAKQLHFAEDKRKS